MSKQKSVCVYCNNDIIANVPIAIKKQMMMK